MGRLDSPLLLSCQTPNLICFCLPVRGAVRMEHERPAPAVRADIACERAGKRRLSDIGNALAIMSPSTATLQVDEGAFDGCAEPAGAHRVADVTAQAGFRAAVALTGTAPFAGQTAGWPA